MSEIRFIQVSFSVVIKGDFRFICKHKYLESNDKLKRWWKEPLQFKEFLIILTELDSTVNVKNIIKDAEWFIETRDTDETLYKFFGIPLPENNNRTIRSYDKTISRECIYRHFKGNYYRVLYIAIDEETAGSRVIYECVNLISSIRYDRKIEVFLSNTDKVKYPDAIQPYRFMNMDELELLLSDEEFRKIQNEYLRLEL